MSELNRTPLTEWHEGHGGRMVPFAGWQMPVQYTSIAQEHLAVRRDVGVFDISHMGRLRFSGPQTVAFLDYVLTRRVSSLKPGQIRYSLVTNAEGGILDDVLVYALQRPDQSLDYRLVVNASNRLKLLNWFGEHRARFDVEIMDETLESGMIAVQGPRALSVAQQVLDDIGMADVRLDSLAYYTGVLPQGVGGPVVVSRTGYTGEDGCEWALAAEHTLPVWQRLIDAGATPAGLGARDTLRLEAAMPLYGHELDETTNPYEAGLGFAVQLKDHDFIGAAVLAKLAQQPPQRVRVGLVAEGRRVPRQDCAVLSMGRTVGAVTSGTFSPTLGVPIAMAYVEPDCAKVGTALDIDIRGRAVPAQVVELPFYDRKRSS